MAYINLSDGEWKIMKLMWQKQPQTLRSLTEALEDETSWNDTTIFVMLKRMLSKGAVRVDKSGRIQQYYPLITRKDVVPTETDAFLHRVYDGSIGMMVSSMAGRHALSEEDIAALRKILDQAERK